MNDDEIKDIGRTVFGFDPTVDENLMRFARAVERAAYELAVDACFEQSDDMASRDYNSAIDDCAAAIRALKKQR